MSFCAVLFLSIFIVACDSTEIDPSKWNLNTSNLTMVVGDTHQIDLEIEGFTLDQFSFTSSTFNIVTISLTGLIEAAQAGVTTITVSYTENPSLFTKTFTVRVVAKSPTSVTITGLSTVDLGEELTLSASITPIDAVQTVVWSSANESVATISQTGVVTPLQAGTAAITATSTDSAIFATKVIEITLPNPTAVFISGGREVLLGNTLQLSTNVTPSLADQQVTWTSLDPLIATVDASGLITPLQEGIATIKATSILEGVYLEAEVSVLLPEAASVEITGETSVVVQDTLQLISSVNPALANQTITWSSSDESIATIDANGLITALKAGTTTIKAQSEDGAYDELVITVIPMAPKSVAIIGDKEVILGNTVQLAASVSPNEALQTIVWISGDSTIATVSPTGLVTPLKGGTVTIKATSTDSLIFDEIDIIITLPAPTDVEVEGDSFVFFGESLQLFASVLPDLASQVVIWSSSDELIATVSTSGVVSSLATGSVTICARVNETIVDQIEITVVEPTTDFYVNPHYFGQYGQIVIDEYDQSIYVGLTGFASINEALNAIPSDADLSTIYVAAGLYTESFTIRNSYVNLIGPNYGINPNYEERGAEAILTGIITIGTGATELEMISIGGFRFTGRAQMIGNTNQSVSYFDFMYNLVENIMYTTSANIGFMQFVSTSLGAGVKDVYIANNKFNNLYSSVSTNIFVRPLWFEFATTITIDNNSITNYERDNYFKDIDGNLIITHNSLYNTKYRFIHVNGFFGGQILVFENTMMLASNTAVAIYGRLEYEAGMTIEVLHNHISGAYNGVYIDPEYLLDGIWVVQKPVLARANYNLIEIDPTKGYWGYGSNNFDVDFTKNYWGTSSPLAGKFTRLTEASWSDYYLSADDVPRSTETAQIYPYGMFIDNPIAELTIGNAHQLEAEFSPVDTNVFYLLWESSDPTVAKVSSSGLIEALKAGTTTITAKAWYDYSVTDSFVVEVTQEPGITFDFDQEYSEIFVGETITMIAEIYPVAAQNKIILWSSSNEAIATVVGGVITTHASGEVTITARFEENLSMTFNMTLVVSEESTLETLLDKLSAVQYLWSQSHTFTVFGATNYTHSTTKSVSLYYFGNIAVTQSILNISPYTRTGRTMSDIPQGITTYNPFKIHYVTIHDTANASSTAGALMHATYLHNLTNNPANTTYVSWHYTVDEGAIYQHIPDYERAFHAGDGSTLVGQSATYLGGGNTNSIGIEMAVNYGNDIYETWQKTAKLAAKLAVIYNLPISHVKYHNDFSGKDCPRSLRNAGLIPLFEQMLDIEYEIALHHPNAVISFVSHSLEYLDNTGRIIKKPVLSQSVSYTISITENDQTVQKTFYTYIPGTVS